MFLHNAVGYRKAEARAVADALCRKERVEYLCQIFRRNALAGIRDLNDDLILAKGQRPKFDRAAGLHRIAGIEDKVREHLLELPAICVNGRERLGIFLDDSNIRLAKLRLEKLQRVVQKLIEVSVRKIR